MGRSIFVTGAGGFVGRRLLAALEGAARVERLRCLVRRPDAVPADLCSASGAELVTGDLRDPEAWAPALAGADTVVHLAAVTGKAPRRTYFEVNADATRELVRRARAAGVRQILFLSSIAASFTDQTRYHYAHSKLRAEEHVHGSGLAYTIFRPAIILGPGAPVLDAFVKLAKAPVTPVFGSGRNRVQPIFVDDLARCIVAMLDRERLQDDTIEIGGPEAVTLEDLLGRIRRRLLGKPPRTIHLPLGPVRAVLGILEPLLLPVLPLTAGQLATFANEGTVEPSSFIEERRRSMKDVDAMLELSFTDG